MNRQQIGIYPTDSVEYRHIEKIADALTEMGVSVDVDTTMSVTSEVGLFLAHRPGNKPGLATTSVCMLHDLSQSHPSWPNFWRYEPWGDFDYGILPNKFWGEMYAGSFIADAVSSFVSELVDNVAIENLMTSAEYKIRPDIPFYPRKGVKILGWPKLDLQNFKTLQSQRQDRRLSVVYAPSWEHDGRQDSFLKAISSLDIKIFIKQQFWEGSGGSHLKKINEMATLHEGKWNNVEILDPKTDIFDVMAHCDVLVSEESSTLIEAAMVGVVPLAVTDWKIPDTTPARLPNVPYDFINKIPESELKIELQKLMEPAYLSAEKERLNDLEPIRPTSSKPYKDIADFLNSLLCETTVPAMVAE